MTKSISYILALQSVYGLGNSRLKALLDQFPDPKEAWLAKTSRLRGFLPENVLINLEEAKKTLDPDQYLEEISKKGIKFLTIYDKEYPKSLLNIDDPPIIIYYFGEFKDEDNQAIGVVGTRKVTGYGRSITEELTRGLVESGLTVVSGLAKGVDSIAHRAALQSGGRTLAVLGGGLNEIFPPENISLAKEISQGHGAVLTEFPPSYPSLPGNFPARNRIISGLSLGVLVTEAAEDSGSLITARFALEQGKDVFAVPGPITSSLSQGPALLIKNGAKLVTKASDITEEFGLSGKPKVKVMGNFSLSELQKEILECLKSESKHIDEICREIQKKPSLVSAELIKMEIMGVIKSLGGGNYVAF